MKVALLAGGLGTRISEESHLKPKPMIEIGGHPLLWHVMKIYSHYGYNDFIICCGYKSKVIKDFFSNYYLYNCDVTFDFSQDGKINVHSNAAEPWRVTLVETGLNTMTGGRVKRIQPYVKDEPFMLTYGDGVADIDIPALLAFHKAHGKKATITSTSVSQRFGVLDVSGDGRVTAFREKADVDGSMVNCGFMVFQPEIFDLLADDDTVLEREPLAGLAASGELMAYRHTGFWQCMDTQRDKMRLETLWETGDAAWKLWE